MSTTKYQRMSNRIAQRWMNIIYPEVTADETAKEYLPQVKTSVESLFNKLPKKAKDILMNCEYHICFSKTINDTVNDGSEKGEEVKDTAKILGLTKPSDEIIMLNLERFSDKGDKLLSEEAFENLFFHESGHYLVHHFTDEEKSVYYKYFGAKPIWVGEPEADSFAAYMRGLAPYHVQEFWSWWVLKDY